MSLPSRTLFVVPALALLAGACGDDVTCVFTTGCQGGSGALSEDEAALPVDRDWIVDGDPRVDGVFPSGTQNAGTTPVVIVFSESMQVSTLVGAFQLARQLGAGLFDQPIPGVAQVLVSDGRVLVLLPRSDAPLLEGDYAVVLAEDATVLDLTGQELAATPGAEIGTFSVIATAPAVPRLVTTFPADDATNQGESTEIVVAFDRRVVEASVDGASFDVKVGGVDPPRDPLAQPIAVDVGSGVLEDTRVFLYRSLEVDGQPASLGKDVLVELRLSPASDPITEPVPEGGSALPATTVSFRTLPFLPPLGASLLSDPDDAIGLANLTDGDPEELQLEVELDGAATNDAIDLFIFGEQRTETPNPPLIAVQRSVRLTGPTPVLSALFLREDIGLQLSDAPDDVRFADGPVTFAFRARRGTVVSPIRVLDLEPDPDTIQDVLLDTTLPRITALIGSTGTDVFRSEQRGLSLAGLANEDLRSVEVTTPLGNNGSLKPVVGSTGGVFLAAPVALGRLVGGGTTYSFAVRDAALNSPPALDGTFTQLGAFGPGAFTPGDTISVEVFDARTLVPLVGARVIVHSDQGDGVSFPFITSGLTLADGHVDVVSAGPPSIGAIVTVDLAGHDLFTLHGVPSTRLSIPLPQSNRGLARAQGDLVTNDAAATALIENLDRRYDDSRRPVALPRGFVGGTCGPETLGFTCSYGPETILDSELGARSFFTGDFGQTEINFSAAQILQGFALIVPLATVPAGGLQPAFIELDSLLIDAQTPPEEAALPLPAFDFVVPVGNGVDLGRLQDDVATTGEPFVDAETLVPGLPGAIAVGPGVTFDRGGGRWQVRAAAPGAITAGGSLGSEGVVETDPFVRVQVLDVDGNAAGVRPRASTILAAGAAAEFSALAVPTLLSPLPAAHTVTQAFTLSLTHAIGDDRPEPGLYRVELRDIAQRRWTLWRFDPAGAAPVPIRVVDPVDGGGVGLANGEVTVTAEAFAWSALTPLDFLWTDVERAFELFSRARSFSFEKP